MNALIENTLHIISRISSSRQGYLLQLNDQGYSVLNILGGKKKDFELFNDVLFNLFVHDGISTDKVASLPPVKKLLKKNSAPVLFIKELINYAERNQVVYILLFFDEKVGFTSECKDIIISILPILSHQVKEWFEQSYEKSEIHTNASISSEEDYRIIENWQSSFNLLLETSPDLIIIVDHSGKIILVNKTGSELLEYSQAELRGKYLIDLVEQEDSAIVNFSMNQILHKNNPVKFKVNLCAKYEQIFPFEINCKKVAKNGEVLGMICICKDLSENFKYLTELQKLNPKLIETNRLLSIERARVKPQKTLMDELNRLKNEFISNISHEFRTTLASIIGFSETIESDQSLPAEMKKEFNRIIMSEGKRLAKLINDVLDASTVEDGKILINKTILDILNLIQEVVDVNYPMATGKKITLSFDHPSEKVFIEADREGISRMISALLNNAIKFTGENGRVKIVVNNLLKEVEIVISDTGIGIPEGDLPYIFQKFYRISRPRGDLSGSRVGLVFVKQIIDLHKGLITVQSEPGSGTTFLVKLPKTSKIGKNEVTFE
jgi:PAS domain S-box-containing protein